MGGHPTKPRVEVRPTTMSDLDHVAAHMREADMEEVMASSGLSPEDGLIWSAANSYLTKTATIDGEPFVVYGLAAPSLMAPSASPWLLGTDRIFEARTSFLRESRRTIPVWNSAHSVLYNYVDAENDFAVQWLKWLGFKFEEPKPYGVAGKPFQFFWRIQNV